MAAGPHYAINDPTVTEVVHAAYVAHEWFGKTWSLSAGDYGGYADYNSEWILSDAYCQLGGLVKRLGTDGYVTTLVGVPLAESAFQAHTDWNMQMEGGEEVEREARHACALGAGRFGKGLVSVFASEWWGSHLLAEGVLLTIAKIPPAILWSMVRLFVLALMLCRAVPASKSGLIYNFCSLKVNLAKHILTFAFGPIRIP